MSNILKTGSIGPRLAARVSYIDQGRKIISVSLVEKQPGVARTGPISGRHPADLALNQLVEVTPGRTRGTFTFCGLRENTAEPIQKEIQESAPAPAKPKPVVPAADEFPVPIEGTIKRGVSFEDALSNTYFEITRPGETFYLPEQFYPYSSRVSLTGDKLPIIPLRIYTPKLRQYCCTQSFAEAAIILLEHLKTNSPLENCHIRRVEFFTGDETLVNKAKRHCKTPDAVPFIVVIPLPSMRVQAIYFATREEANDYAAKKESRPTKFILQVPDFDPDEASSIELFLRFGWALIANPLLAKPAGK